MNNGKMIMQLMGTGRFTLEDREDLQKLGRGDLEVLLGLYLDAENKNKVKFILRASGVMVNSIREMKIRRNERLLQESYRIIGVLNTEIHKVCDYIQTRMDAENFNSIFELSNLEPEDWKYSDDEDYYSNLISTPTDIGHCVRQSLINGEKYLKEMLS